MPYCGAISPAANDPASRPGAEPLAFSIDGRTFGYEVPVKRAFRLGSYVSIKTKDAEYLGQITAQDVATRDGPQYGITATTTAQLFIARSNMESNFVDRVRIRYVQGAGELIRRLTPDGIQRATDREVFEDAKLELASEGMIASYLTIDGKHRLDVGYALGVEPGKVRAQLQPKGFRRHTFMCGQSRSGKTFALGVMLEQLLLADNSFRMAILDPNSDFVRLNELRTQKEYSAVESQYSSCQRLSEFCGPSR